MADPNSVVLCLYTATLAARVHTCRPWDIYRCKAPEPQGRHGLALLTNSRASISLLSPSPRAPLRKWAVCSGEPLPQQFAWWELYLSKDPSVTTNVQRSTIVSLGWVWSKLPHFAWVVSTSCLWKANNRSLNCTAARSYRVHPVSQKLSLMAFQVTYGILSHP